MNPHMQKPGGIIALLDEAWYAFFSTCNVMNVYYLKYLLIISKHVPPHIPISDAS